MQAQEALIEQDEQPITLETAMATAIKLHQTGKLDSAEVFYRLILTQLPQLPEALHFLGMLTHQKGDSEGGIALIEQALAEAPEYADAHNNLGNIYNIQGQPAKSAECYRRALAINPDNISAHNNLGVALKDLGQFDEAVAAFLKALALMPDNAEFYRNLGNVYKKQCKFEEATQAFTKALGLRSYDAEDYESLCFTLYLQGNVEGAIVLVKQWLQHEPDHPIALHRLSAYLGENLDKASDAYVTQAFDGFADSFDYVLKGLDYRAPFLILEAIKEIYDPPAANLTLLDAGCGTGLCGPLLKPYAEQLLGVDLSAKMLEKAQKRACYDDLVQSELVAYIGSQQARFDSIISADTLVYFGALEGVCQAVAGALKPGGYLVFTVESSADNLSKGYKINPHGRFSHTQTYLYDVLTGSGLSVIKIDAVGLRYEAGVLVNGFLAVARLDVAH